MDRNNRMPGIVLVDKSEKSSNPKLFKAVEKFFPKVHAVNLPHKVYGERKITSGDINIPLEGWGGELLAVERKTAEDFLASIGKRRIFHQVEVMANNSKYSAVIVTGQLTYTEKTDMAKADGNETGWSGIRVRAVISEIQFSGCPVIFCPHTEFCNQVLELYHIVNKPSNERQGVFKNRILTFPPVDFRVEFLAQLPGVGMKLADSLLTFAGKMDGADKLGYGSISSALHWVSVLNSIHPSERPTGWSSTRILTVRKFLALEQNEYLVKAKELENEMISIDEQIYQRTPF